MSDVNDSQILDRLNGIRRWKRPAAYFLAAAGLIAVLAVGGVLGVNIRDWWKQRQVDETNLRAMVVIVQYNLQQGRLLMPPVLMPTPPPAAAPAPEKKPGG